jgi:hypothetical protein
LQPVRLVLFACITSFAGLAQTNPPSVSSLLDLGYKQMYNLQFDEAHKTFAEAERLYPSNALGPVSNAAAYLFAELDRLRILQSEFFVHDANFKTHEKLTPEPSARRAFDRELRKGDTLSQAELARSPDDQDALFAKAMVFGLRSDYDALIDKHYLTSLKSIRTSRLAAEKLLSINPDYYDAYLAIGVENYMLSLKPAPLRWLLQLGGAETDKQTGLEKLRLTAEKGHYLRPYARLLLAIAALRDKDRPTARNILSGLAHNFPQNRLYSEELARLR